MRAVVQSRYGPPDQVLTVADVAVPQPGSGQVLVQVAASSVHSDVWHSISGFPALLKLMGGGVRRPRQRVPGVDIAGVVTSLGPGSSRHAVGAAVVGCVVGANLWRNGGALAEYAVVDEKRLEPKPERLSWEQAACVPSCGVIAVQVVRDEACVASGQRVLVNGAGGAVGSFAVQLAVAAGAHVTAVDRASKEAAVRGWGASEFLDFEASDPTRPATDREPYAAVIDIASTRPFADWRRVLAGDGVYVVVGHDHYGRGGGRIVGSVPRVLGLTVRGAFSKQLPGFRAARGGDDRLAHLLNLVEQGSVTPVVDRVFPLEAIKDAMTYLATEAPAGRVAISVAPDL